MLGLSGVIARITLKGIRVGLCWICDFSSRLQACENIERSSRSDSDLHALRLGGGSV